MNALTRRKFLGEAAMGAAAMGGGVLLRGCSTGRDFDLVIAGGAVYDGTGAAPAEADIGVVHGVIRAIGKIAPRRARAVVSAAGRAVAPGFIDVHEHTAVELLVNPRAESAVHQGVTTLVSGNCGDSPFPLNDAMLEEMKKGLADEYGLDVNWKNGGGFFDRLSEGGSAVNYSSFVGHGTIRAAAVGYADRPASPSELGLMKSMVAEAMAAGALGLSSGLEYSPGSFASTEELIELSREAARRRGVYATHVRDEEAGILEAVDEAFRICREAPVRLQISHIKVGYAPNWPKFDELLVRLDEARRQGLDFRCDRYPYTAWSTGLNMFFPLWSREGTSSDFVSRLKDLSLEPRLKAEVLEKGEALGSWDKVLISGVGPGRNRALEGASIEDASRRAGLEPYEFMRNLLIEEKGAVTAITFAMSEDHLKVLLAHPLVGVGSDGAAVAPYGPLSKGKPHPRFYGTFPRVLGRYVRDEQIVSLPEMIRKMTSMPAAHLGFKRRGILREGYAADIAVFDPARINDLATWTEPARYPAGMDHVIVNGVVVIESGEHTGRLPGRILRRDDGGEVA